MTTRIKAFAVDTLLADYEKVIVCLKNMQQSDYDLELLLALLRQSRLSSSVLLPLEIVARLDAYLDPDTSLYQLRQQALNELETGSTAALIPLYPCLASADVNEWQLTGCRQIGMVSSNGKRMAVGFDRANGDGLRWAIIDLDYKYSVKDIDEASIAALSFDGNFAVSVIQDVSSKQKKPPGTLSVGKEKLGSQSCTTIQLTPQGAKKSLSVVCTAVNAKATKLAVIHDEIYISIWDLCNQKQLRSNITFKGWTKFYHIIYISNDDIIGLVRNGEGKDGIVYISNSPKGDNFAIDLRSPLVQDTLQIDHYAARVVGKSTSLGESGALLYVDLKSRAVRTLVESVEGPFLVHPLWHCVYFWAKDAVQCLSLQDQGSMSQVCAVDDISALAMDEDGEHLVAASSHGISIWRAEGGDHVGKIASGLVTYLAVTQCGEDYMVSLDKDGILNVYNWKLLLQRVCSTEDSSKNATANTDDQSIVKQTGAERCVFLAHNSLCTVSDTGCLTIWSTETFAALHSVEIGTRCCRIERLSDDRLMLLDQNGCVLVWSKDKPEETTPIALDGTCLTFCLNTTLSNAYVLVKGKVMQATRIDTQTLKEKRSWDITGKVEICDPTMKVSNNEKFLVVKNRCSETELDIICKSELKNNLFQLQNCPFKFLCLDLSQRPCNWGTCHRYMTKIPMRAHTLDTLGEGMFIMGRGRITTVWDVAQDKCDQILVKGTKTPQFFRPSWLETDETWKTVNTYFGFAGRLSITKAISETIRCTIRLAYKVAGKRYWSTG